MKETIIIILWVLLIMLALLSLTFIVKNSENRGKTAIGVCIFITSMIILFSSVFWNESSSTPKIESTKQDSVYIINNMKYIIINDNVINITKDSLECQFYLTDGL